MASLIIPLQQEPPKCSCGGQYEWSKTCGCLVCDKCDDHSGFARCFCGWAADGGNGYAQLLDEGEVIEPEE